jgi:hypothetical protein
VTPARRRTLYRAAWGVMLAALAAVAITRPAAPPDRPAALERAATLCAVALHRQGVTPAPGGCDPRR